MVVAMLVSMTAMRTIGSIQATQSQSNEQEQDGEWKRHLLKKMPRGRADHQCEDQKEEAIKVIMTSGGSENGDGLQSI